jgi:hypothetical protein
MDLEMYDFQQLQHRFLEQQLPFRYDVEYIRDYLIGKYRAYELEASSFSDLVNDPFYDNARDTHVFAIPFEDVIVEHHNPQHRIAAIEAGHIAYLIFQSSHGKVDCDFFSLHGDSECLEHEMMVLNGISPELARIEEPAFQFYLATLSEIGMI